MKKLIILIVVLSLLLATTVVALAGKPDNPGCFGRDRAAYANEYGSLGNEFGGVGYYASERAGTNGALNQAYKAGCGGAP